MKLIILLLIVLPILFGGFGEAFRLPHLDKTHKDPLHLSALFNSISNFINGIDTKADSNLKHHLNITKRKSLPGPNPNTFFPYVHLATKPKFPNNVNITSTE